MNWNWTIEAAVAAGAISLAASLSSADLKVISPKCEYGTNPLGMDATRPRLAWALESDQRGTHQAAYRVLVASSEDGLKQGTGDLWDSGVVKSDQSIQVEYAGAALKSRQRAYWQVEVWDNHDQHAISKPARWEMGLLEPSDRTAQWISFQAPGAAADHDFTGASWIWSPEKDQAHPPEGHRYFRHGFELPKDDAVASAMISVSVDDQFTLMINGKEAGASSGKIDAWRSASSFDVAKLLKGGVNTIAVKGENTKDGAGLLAALTITLKSGKTVRVVSDGSWTASGESPAGWESAAKDPQGWVKAATVAPYGKGPWGQIVAPLPLGSCPHFRTTVKLDKDVKSARLYASALGLYEFRINGKRVGDDCLTPGWTDYNARVQYQTYDITGMLRKGENAMGVILGDGWYAGHVGLGGAHRYGKLAKAWGQVEIEFADGSRATMGTDGTWKASNGPLLQSDTLMGETYDARKELPGWDAPGFDDSTWSKAKTETVKTPLVASVDLPVRRIMELTPKAVSQPAPGTYIFDLGQNMVGWAKLKVKGDAGKTVTLRFAEVLNPDGTIYITNLRGAKCTDYYTLKGGETETFEPRFTFHGFRYVEVTGYPGAPGMDAITGVVAMSDTPPSGSFECSDSRINQLQSNITWGQRGNFVSVPTDCPQRDERLGWMGDAQIFVRTSTFNMDVARFFTKWCRDVEDAQRPDGAFTDVAPFVAAGAGTAAWGDAGVICPWTIYRVYGDTKILRDHYASAQRWISYLQAHSKDLLRPAEGYGDWISIGADTPKDVLGTAYFALSTRIVADWAGVIGKHEDAQKYRDLLEQIKAAFNRAYVSADGRIKGDTQTCYVLALAFDLLPAELRGPAGEHLAADIKAKGDHLSTGFVGVGHLTPTLTSVGRTDLAYTLLMQDTFPGWLYSVKNGATTIWERWDGWTKEKGFQDPGMNSFNHYSLGSVGEWMYSTVLGIDLDPQTPGFKRAVIHPRVGGGLSWARGHYDSMYGRYSAAWKKDGNTMTLDVTVPANATAAVILPEGASVTEGGKPCEEATGVRVVRRGGGDVVLEIGSGNYSFGVK